MDEIKKSRRVTSIDDTEDYLEPVDPNLPSDPLLRRRIVTFGQLSENCKEVLTLIALGMTYDDIKDITKRTTNTVAGSVYRCRDKLRLYLYGITKRELIMGGPSQEELSSNEFVSKYVDNEFENKIERSFLRIY